MLGKLKQKFVSWLLKGVHIDVLHIGKHSVVISGTGANLDGQKIENVGAPDSDDDVPRRDTIDAKITTHGEGAKHRWTLNKLRKGAGSEADPTEIDVPVGATLVLKTSDEVVNNSSTLQNDDELLLPVGINEIWEFLLLLRTNTITPTTDLDIAFSLPTNGNLRGIDLVLSVKGESVEVDGAVEMKAIATSGDRGFLRRYVYIGGDTAGNIQLQWAQTVATEEDTTVKANSFILAHKLA